MVRVEADLYAGSPTNVLHLSGRSTEGSAEVGVGVDELDLVEDDHAARLEVLSTWLSVVGKARSSRSRRARSDEGLLKAWRLDESRASELLVLKGDLGDDVASEGGLDKLNDGR